MLNKQEIYPGRFFRIPYRDLIIESPVYDVDKKVYFKVDKNVFEVSLEDIQPILLDCWWRNYLKEGLEELPVEPNFVHQAQIIYFGIHLKEMDFSKVPVSKGRVLERMTLNRSNNS